MSTGKNLYIITMEYPYGKGEAFMEDELEELAKVYDKVFLFPYLKSDPSSKRSLPGNNIETIDVFQIDESTISKSVLSKNLGKVLQMISKDGTKKLREKLVLFKNCLFKAQLLTEFLSKDKSDKHFYSMWMSTPSTILSILKSRGVIKAFVSRAHGVDIVPERHEGNFIPLLKYNSHFCDKIFLNSEYSFEQVSTVIQDVKKLSVQYFGLKDHFEQINTPAFQDETLYLVSVSNLYPFKRVDKIMQVVEELAKQRPVNWVHFGDGQEFENLRSASEKLGSNIKADFKGFVSKEEILDQYIGHYVDLFIHLSEVEAFGVAIVEAQCHGIPVVAARSGGVPETIREGAGFLVENESSPADIAALILKEFTSDQILQLRSAARSNFVDRFEASNRVLILQQQIESAYVN